MNIPNTFTMMRIALIPFLIVFHYAPFTGHYYVAAFIFVLASVTDWLDGYLARKLSQHSRIGAFLDPVADKLLVAVALIMIVEKIPVVIVTVPAMIIVGREIVISALREWMAELGKSASMAVTRVAKVKTALQMVAATLLLAYSPSSSSPVIAWVGLVLLMVAAVMTLWSMFIYLNIARRQL